MYEPLSYRDTPAELPDDVQEIADMHEDGQLRLGVAGDQLAVLPLPQLLPPEVVSA